jgi:adenosine deaminase
MTPPMRDVRALPKGHLHLHLEGAMRPSTLAELAERDGVTVPAVDSFSSFEMFIQLYMAACDVLRTPDDVARLVREVVEDAAAAGATWVEPTTYPPRHANLGSEEEVLEIMLDAARAAEAATGVGVGFVVTADRSQGVADAMRQAQVATRYAGRGVVAFGLAADEAHYPPEPFAEPFAVARRAGLISAPHAGELSGPASVRGALDVLHADRLAHGVRAVEEPALVREIANRGVCLDVCPTSNALLRVVPSIDQHPLPELLRAGVRCSLNGDDPLFFGADLAAEYELCRARLGLDDAALAGIARVSLEASGAPESRKAAGLRGIEAWLTS